MRVLWLPPPAALPNSLSELRAAASRSGRPTRRAPGPAERASPRDAAYDAHFRVARSRQDPANLLAAALHETTAPWWRVPGAESEHALSAALDLLGLPASARQPPYRPRPLTRWLLGHRLFFALTQAAIVALRERPTPCTSAAAAQLLRSCAARMRLTAGFAPADYEATVRPSMTPAAGVAPGFSGLWSADHRALVLELRHWGAAHDRTCPALPELRTALADVHAAHRGVCARFVGHRPSLLTDDTDALATLDHLSAVRQGLLRPSRDTC